MDWQIADARKAACSAVLTDMTLSLRAGIALVTEVLKYSSCVEEVAGGIMMLDADELYKTARTIAMLQSNEPSISCSSWRS